MSGIGGGMFPISGPGGAGLPAGTPIVPSPPSVSPFVAANPTSMASYLSGPFMSWLEQSRLSLFLKGAIVMLKVK